MNPSNLSQMHDIIVPEFHANLWPLAWGYWLLISLSIGLIVVAIVLIKRHFRTYQALYDAFAELKHQTFDRHQANILLKRVAIHYHGRQKIASLVGEQWLKYLKLWSKPVYHQQIDQLFASQYQAQSTEHQQPLEQDMKKIIKHIMRRCSRQREASHALL